MVTYGRQLFRSIEQVPYRGLVRQHSAHNSQDIEGRPLELAVVLNDGYQAVSDNRNIDLYPNSVLSVAPEGRDSEMLLYPSEEQFYLPSLLVQQSGIACLERKVVGQERERSLQFRSVVNDSPESTRILLLGLIARKAYRLIKQNVIRAVKQVLTFNNLIVEMRLLSAHHLPEAVATGKLSEHHHKKLVPASESLHLPVASTLLDYSIKCSLGQKVDELIEDRFSAIHLGLSCLQAAKLRNHFKSTRAILLITY